MVHDLDSRTFAVLDTVYTIMAHSCLWQIPCLVRRCPRAVQTTQAGRHVPAKAMRVVEVLL